MPDVRPNRLVYRVPINLGLPREGRFIEMLRPVIIESARDGASLRLSDPVFVKHTDDHGLEYFRVTAAGPAFSGALRVYAYMSSGLPALFEEFARNWRGFDGEKSWSSLEGEFSLRASVDKLGHTWLGFILHERDHGWKLEGGLLLEAGQLEHIARDVRRFCDGDTR